MHLQGLPGQKYHKDIDSCHLIKKMEREAVVPCGAAVLLFNIYTYFIHKKFLVSRIKVIYNVK